MPPIELRPCQGDDDRLPAFARSDTNEGSLTAVWIEEMLFTHVDRDRGRLRRADLQPSSVDTSRLQRDPLAQRKQTRVVVDRGRPRQAQAVAVGSGNESSGSGEFPPRHVVSVAGGKAPGADPDKPVAGACQEAEAVSPVCKTSAEVAFARLDSRTHERAAADDGH